MELNTASAAIGFAKALEEDSAKFYEDLSRRYPQNEEVFFALVKENRKNAAQVQRAYYEVITDAIEGCFAFNMNPDEYTLKTELAEETGYPEALEQAVAIEDKIIKFYLDAAEQSKSLLADVPRTFKMIARKRDNRLSILKSLAGKKD
ncbi:hypothetical protein ACFLXG_02195 [Chloroflexota bacterium]